MNRILPRHIKARQQANTMDIVPIDTAHNSDSEFPQVDVEV